MPAEPQTNTISPVVKDRSVASGDVPEALRRRYYLDGRGGDLAFYVDATVKAPAFHDRGRRLVAARTDPNAIRDMMAIARHRQWMIVTVRGAADFRREAWLAGRSSGLEVRGYRPTERDLQDLERRSNTKERYRASHDRLGVGASSTLDVIRTVVRARVASPSAQARIIAAARERVAGWLERGATFAPLSPRNEAEIVTERRRARQR